MKWIDGWLWFFFFSKNWLRLIAHIMHLSLHIVPTVHTLLRLNGTFVNKYAWDGICKYSTFQQVSFLLFLLFLSQNVWFLFRLICWLERMHVWVKANEFPSEDRRLSQLRVVKKAWIIRCFVIHFLKNERACLFESLHHGIFVEVGVWVFPTFKAFISFQILLCQKN